MGMARNLHRIYHNLLPKMALKAVNIQGKTKIFRLILVEWICLTLMNRSSYLIYKWIWGRVRNKIETRRGSRWKRWTVHAQTVSLTYTIPFRRPRAVPTISTWPREDPLWPLLRECLKLYRKVFYTKIIKILIHRNSR